MMRSDFHLEISINLEDPLYILFMSDNGVNADWCKSYTHEFFGVLENGQKVYVEVTNILLYFDIEMIHSDIDTEVHVLRTILHPYGLAKSEVINAKPFREYSLHNKPYFRAYMTTFKGRKDAINQLRNMDISGLYAGCNETKYKTGSDELQKGEMVYKLAREYQFSLSDWNVINKYTVISNSTILHIRCNINNIYFAPQNEPRMAIPELIRPVPEFMPVDINSIKRRRFLFMYFDIETHTYRRDPIVETSRAIPLPNYDEDSIFLVSCVFYWSDQSEIMAKPFYVKSVFNTYGKFDRSHIDASQLEDKLSGSVSNTIYVNSECDLLTELGNIIHDMRPDIISGYNIAQYDMPFVIYRCQRHNILNWFYNRIKCNKYVNKQSDDNIVKYNFRKSEIKIPGAGVKAEGHVLDVPGILFVDTMQQMRKMFPSDEKYSLNHFLDKLVLGQKEEMSYGRLFDVVDNIRADKDINTLDIAETIYYCEIDSTLCHRLWTKQKIIMIYRNHAELSFVNLRHAFMRADGSKVTQMIMANAVNYIFEFNNPKDTDTSKFSGAYVVIPRVRGRYDDRPVEEEDVVSLYPSIMIAYNLSCEMIIRDPEYAQYVSDNGVRCKPLNVQVCNVEHKGHVVFHENDPNKKGVYTKILEYLKNRRATLKSQLKPLEKERNSTNDPIKRAELSYQYDVADAIQLSAKIFMNTFYGKAGDRTSTLFNILLAASVTSIGQMLLKAAHTLTLAKGYFIIYGDTDSMYVAAPQHLFETTRQQYKDGVIDQQTYFNNMCRISKVAGDELQTCVNELFEKITETKSIKLNHDTSGFPSFWACKKKYCYLKQGNTAYIPDSFDDRLFKITGLAIVNRGRSKILQDVGKNIISQMMRVDHTEYKKYKYVFDKDFYIYNRDDEILTSSNTLVIVDDLLLYLVVEEIRKIFNSPINIDDFKLSATYRPGKKNVKINKFIERLKSRNIKTPDSGERFEYVIVQPDKITNSRGNFMKYNVGDLMETPEYAKEHNKQICLKHYMSGEFNGMLVRFVSHLFFDRNPDNTLTTIFTEADEEVYEALAHKKAHKLIESIIEHFSGFKKTRTAVKKLAVDEFKKVKSHVDNLLYSHYKVTSIIDKVSRLHKKIYKINDNIDIYDEDVMINIPKCSLTAKNKIIKFNELMKDDKLLNKIKTEHTKLLLDKQIEFKNEYISFVELIQSLPTYDDIIIDELNNADIIYAYRDSEDIMFQHELLNNMIDDYNILCKYIAYLGYA